MPQQFLFLLPPFLRLANRSYCHDQAQLIYNQLRLVFLCVPQCLLGGTLCNSYSTKIRKDSTKNHKDRMDSEKTSAHQSNI